MAIFALLAIHN